jgi:hypothetical protein
MGRSAHGRTFLRYSPSVIGGLGAQGALTLRDVKNEGTSGDVYENKGDDDKMSIEKHGFYTKMYSWREDQQASAGFLGPRCISYAIIRGEGGTKNIPRLIGPSIHRTIFMKTQELNRSFHDVVENKGDA